MALSRRCGCRFRAMLPADDQIMLLAQINDLYAYQVAFGARLVLEGPYVPSFGSDIAGGPPGLGVRSSLSSQLPPCRLMTLPPRVAHCTSEQCASSTLQLHVPCSLLLPPCHASFCVSCQILTAGCTE